MEYIWKDYYSVGIEEIDTQHRMFFAIINRLEEIAQPGAKREEVVRALTNLTSYANYHFAEEEKYFKIIRYKRASVHIAMHNRFKGTLNAFIERLEADDPSLPMGMAEFARNWLHSHLMKEDRDFAVEYTKYRAGITQQVKVSR
jgi:hemerythrin